VSDRDDRADRAAEGTWLEPVPKGTGGDRLIAHLGSSDLRDYHASVAPLVDRIECALGPRAVANRARSTRVGPPAVALEPWSTPRRRFRRLAVWLAGVTGRSSVAAMADVRDCYGSIRDDVLEQRLCALGVDAGEIRRLRGVLDRVHERGIRGLPVGPEPSAALANAVLQGVDRVLEERRVRHVRWVDDVWMFARNERSAASAMHALEDALGDIALSLAPEKTRLIATEAFAECVRSEGISNAGTRL
jgi:hypothetical protein